MLYDYDSNVILTEALKTRQGPELLKAYAKIIKYLQARGFHTRVHWLDNEASSAMKTYDQKNHIEYQLVPPHMHQRNVAERAIRNWKITSLLDYAARTRSFPCTCGVAYYYRPPLP